MDNTELLVQTLNARIANRTLTGHAGYVLMHNILCVVPDTAYVAYGTARNGRLFHLTNQLTNEELAMHLGVQNLNGIRFIVCHLDRCKKISEM